MPALLSLLALALAACEGDQGPTGPAGNANVASGTFTLAPGAYANSFWFFSVEGGNQGNRARVATVEVPEITEAVLNDGVVLVYLRIPSSPTTPADEWTLLPFHQGGFGGGYLVSIKASVDEGRIRIGYVHESTSGSTPPDVYQASLPTYEFRWVVIGGPPPDLSLHGAVY
jgi:hypothetical protein